MSAIETALAEKGLTLPEAVMPAANYVPYAQSGNLIYISGQLPMQDGKPQFIGKVAKDFSIEEGQECAKICGLNILAHLKVACGGDFDRVVKCVRMGIFVNAPDDFTDHPKVANGVSDMMVELFGDKGKHARFAVGVSGLPFGVAVEVDATFEIT
jgi:enamine deaminase RidA (YjgF/YER057c/UK114 family)